MTYSIEFIPEAAADYKSLDGSVKKKVNKKLEELSKNPFLGEYLGNKFNIDLTGFYKLYVDNGESAPSRHLIPVHVGTLFRNMPAGDSGASRHVLVI